jgi:hypothetical protein
MSDLQQQTKESIVLTENEIRLIKQSDGNWKGYLLRDKERLEVREIDPYTCLTRLLTHS